MARSIQKKIKKVLFVNPAYAVETGKNRKETYGAAILPPLGMLNLAGEVENKGYEVYFIDAEAELINDEQVLARILEIKPDVVGFYCISANFHRLVKFSKVIKKKLSARIFFGGPHVWNNWEEAVKSGAVDFVVTGEAEKTFVETLDRLNEGKSLKDVKGLAYLEKNKPFFTGQRPFLKNLDELAYAAYHLVDLSLYKPSPQHIRRKPSALMMAARGCPFHCTFCYIPYLFKCTYRTRSVDHVVGEIKSLIKKHGIKEIQFMDDSFGVDRKWLEEFSDRLISEKVNITWSCLTRLGLLDWEIACKMKKAGCWCVFFGVESLDQEVLDAINKKQTVEQIEKALKACKKIGIEVRANIILGSPTETPEKVKKMIKKLCELNPDYVKFNVMCPYPGTKIYDEIVKEGKWGRLIDDYNSEKLTNHEVVFIPFGYKNEKEILDIRKYAYRKYYFRLRYILSRIRSIRTFYDIKRYLIGFRLIAKRYLF